jgi:chromosome segregation ATPase
MALDLNRDPPAGGFSDYSQHWNVNAGRAGGYSSRALPEESDTYIDDPITRALIRRHQHASSVSPTANFANTARALEPSGEDIVRHVDHLGIRRASIEHAGATAIGGVVELDSEAERMLADKLSRAEQVIQNAEREYERAMSSLEAEQRKLASERDEERMRLSIAEDRAVFLQKETTTWRVKAADLQEELERTDQRATAQRAEAEAAKATVIATFEAELAAVNARESRLTTSLEENERRREDLSVRLDTADSLVQSLLRAGDEAQRSAFVGRERAARLTLLFNEGEGRSTLWELSSRFLAAQMEVSEADGEMLRRQIRRLEDLVAANSHIQALSPPRYRAFEAAADMPVSPTGALVVAHCNGHEAFDATVTASPDRARIQATVALGARVRELEHALANALTDLERERVAGKELRSALEQLYTLLDRDGGSALSSDGVALFGVDAQSAHKRRDTVASLLTAGELARVKSDLQVERGRAEALHANQAKLELQLRESTDECQRLNVECDALQAALRRVQSEQRRERAHVAELELGVTDLQKQRDALREEVSRLEGRSELASRLEQQLTKDLQVAADANARLGDELMAARARAALAAGADATRRELEAAAAERVALETANARLGDRLKNLAETSVPRAEHDDAVAELTARVAQLERRVRAYEAKDADMAATLARSVREQAELAEARDTIQQLDTSLREAHDLAQAAQQSHVREAAMFGEKVNAFASENSTLRFQLHSSQARLLQLQSEFESARSTDAARLEELAAAASGEATEREAFLADKLLVAADEIDRLEAERDIWRTAARDSQGGINPVGSIAAVGTPRGPRTSYDDDSRKRPSSHADAFDTRRKVATNLAVPVGPGSPPQFVGAGRGPAAWGTGSHR